MRYFAVIIVLLTMAVPLTSSAKKSADSQRRGNRLFEQYPFEEGGYSIVGKLWDGPRNAFTSRLGDFYIDDVRLLKKMRSQWVAGKRSPQYACGYHYGIYVVRNGEILERILLNLENGCNAVSTKNGIFKFNPQLLEQLESQLKPMRVERISFTSAREGREYLRTIKNDTNLLTVFFPEWAEFDGEFRYEYNCSYRPLLEYVEKCVEEAKKEIKFYYAEEIYCIELGGLSNNSVLIKVRSRKSLYEKFTLHPISWKWKEYPPQITVAWKMDTSVGEE